jgi:hypothetical protein
MKMASKMKEISMKAGEMANGYRGSIWQPGNIQWRKKGVYRAISYQ